MFIIKVMSTLKRSDEFWKDELVLNPVWSFFLSFFFRNEFRIFLPKGFWMLTHTRAWDPGGIGVGSFFVNVGGPSSSGKA